MPYTYHIDPAQRLATIVITGTVTGEEVLSSLRALARDPAWQPGFSRLWDFRGAGGLKVSRVEIDTVRKELADEHYRAHRTAVIVHRDVLYNVVELFQSFLKRWPVRSFWREDKALAWLREAAPGNERRPS
jgi:hypothetical protein